MDLSVNLGKLKLKNPVTVASGTFGYAKEFENLVNLRDLGAIITKTITGKPRLGNPPPRLVETAAGMLNAIGLQNEGIDDFLKVKFPALKVLGTKIIVSISAEKIEEFAQLAGRLEDQGVEAVELNLSCPNIKYEGKKSRSANMFAQSPKAVSKIVSLVRKKTKLIIIPKLSPNVTDIVAIACSAEDSGADAVSLVNTFLGIAIDSETCRPKLANITGGLSGPAIKPMALRMVYEVSRSVKMPVIGMGGIMNLEDALEFIVAGAAAISVGTANFVNPKISVEIITGLKKYLKQKKIKKISQLVGSLKV